MRNSIRLSLVFLSSTVVMGCRFSPSHDDFSVYGYWEWVKTQGAWTGSINTPALSGYTAKVLFQENGVAQFYRNDTLVTQIPFTLSTTNILGDRKDVFVIHWSNKNYPDDQCILFSGNDTLHLTARGTEISHYYYVRVHH